MLDEVLDDVQVSLVRGKVQRAPAVLDATPALVRLLVDLALVLHRHTHT